MRLLAVLLLAAYCQARPMDEFTAHPGFIEMGVGSFIVGGQPATPGQIPWNLSLERLQASWSHWCGSSLLAAQRTLSAAHCVDGVSVGVLRVVAGLHDRSNPVGAVYSNLASYQMHQSYNDGTQTFNNDIAILRLVTPILEQGWIRYARLPANNNNQHVGESCVISGWGRTSASNVPPNILMFANIDVISEADCNSSLAPVSGARVGPGQICLYRPIIATCNGDSGGPVNCLEGGVTVVSGVISWGIQSGGACIQTYPSVCTRTGYFLGWIESTP